MKILVIGAGISGLSFLHAALAKGLSPTLIERAPKWSKEGAGICLPGNAMIAFEKLGFADKIMNASHQVSHVTYAKSNGEVLSSASLNQSPLDKAPFVSLARAELLNILREDMDEHVLFNTEIESLETNDRGVKVTFHGGKIDVYDLIVAADGIHSRTREMAFRDSALEDLGVTNWRFISSSLKKQEPIYYIGSDSAFMIYPMGDDKVYCYAQVLDENKTFLNTDAKQSLEKIFQNYAPEVLQSIQELDNEEIVSGSLSSVTNTYYPHKNIALIGDALHGCPPSLQQGVGMGVEDALVLAQVLSGLSQDEALQEFTVLRQKRVDWVVEESNKIIRLASTGKSWIGRIIRNMMIRVKGPANVAGWKRLMSQEA